MTSTSLPESMQPASAPLTPARRVAMLMRWFEPRSKNRDERFRERTVRVIVALTLIVMSLSFFASLFVYRDPWGVISFPTMHLAVLVLFSVAAVAVARENLEVASWMVVFGIIVGVIFNHWMFASAQANTQTYFVSIPMFMIPPLGAAVLLRRRWIHIVSFATIVIFVVIDYLLVAAGLQAEPMSQSTIVTLGVLLLGESVILNTLRNEFDNRFDALTELIHLEEHARQQAEADRKRAEDADRAKSQFLANMSHELRTPLNAIIGYSDILVGGMVGDIAQPQLRLLNNIQSNSRRLLSLINDILDLSKIEAGKLEVYNAPLQPRRLITETVDSLRALADEKSIALEVHIADEVPEVIMSDARKIAQILINLVSNAIKFTSVGGVYLDVTADATNWKIKVRDTGDGIPADAIAYIFEPFRQVDSTDRRQHKGTGLGLAIVKALAVSLQGSIEVESKLGSGSTFTVVFPRNIPVEIGSVTTTESNANEIASDGSPAPTNAAANGVNALNEAGVTTNTDSHAVMNGVNSVTKP